MGKLYIVATPIGNLGDISARALETFRNVDIIAAEDTRHSGALLAHFGINTPLISYHKYSEEQRAPRLIQILQNENKSIALITDAGTPCVSDPGYRLVRYAREAGVEVIAIPGASAVMAAISVCGFDASRFAFYGFLPKKDSELRKTAQEIIMSAAEERGVNVVVFYESPRRLLDTLIIFSEVLCGHEAMVCVCNDLTKMYEASYYGGLKSVIEQITANPNAEKGEYTVVLQLPRIMSQKENPLSTEALIVDAMVKEGISLKEAVKAVKAALPAEQRAGVYDAAVRLRELLVN